jgi:peptide/nickel transport system permease protein
VSTAPIPIAITVRRRSGLSLVRATGPAGIISAVVIGVATLVAVLGPTLAPETPYIGQLSDSYVGPIAGHPLGFDGQGRDLLSRLLVGARTTMLGALAVVVICILVGTLLAVSAAWRRGAYDAVVSSGLDILFAFPGILLAILAATVFGASLIAASLALAVAYTPYVARVLRGAALRERSQAYVAALEVQGASALAICLRHLIPNMLPLIVAQATILFGYAMVDLAAISFIGLGVQPPNPDWGVMISENQSGVVQGYPLAALSAGICIVAVVVAFNILGERLYDQAQASRG